MLDPATAAAIAGLLGGLFGKRPKMDPRQKAVYEGQMGIAGQLKDYAGSVPLSDPGELAALAQQRGLLGEDQRNAQSRLFADIGQNQGMGNIGDLLANLSSQQTGQRMSLTAQALMQALQARRQALLQSSNVLSAAGQAASAPKEGGQDLSGPLSQAAYAYYQNKAAGNNPVMASTVQGNPTGSPFGGGVGNNPANNGTSQAANSGIDALFAALGMTNQAAGQMNQGTLPVVNANSVGTYVAEPTPLGGSGFSRRQMQGGSPFDFSNLLPSARTPNAIPGRGDALSWLNRY